MHSLAPMAENCPTIGSSEPEVQAGSHWWFFAHFRPIEMVWIELIDQLR
jgi:hypothetical protein